MTFEWSELKKDLRFDQARSRIRKRIDRKADAALFELDLIGKAAMLALGIETDGQLRMFR